MKEIKSINFKSYKVDNSYKIVGQKIIKYLDLILIMNDKEEWRFKVNISLNTDELKYEIYIKTDLKELSSIYNELELELNESLRNYIKETNELGYLKTLYKSMVSIENIEIKNYNQKNFNGEVIWEIELEDKSSISKLNIIDKKITYWEMNIGERNLKDINLLKIKKIMENYILKESKLRINFMLN